ncbi:MAG TPA: MarR family transcriptional regulator [Pseudonocardiaceae bacterium]
MSDERLAAPTQPGVLADDLRVALMRVSRRIRLEGAGGKVTPSQFSVLAALKHGPLTLRELADREQVQPPAMTRTVASLVELRLVARVQDQHDRRQAVVSLTRTGRRLVDETRNQRTEWLARRLVELSDEERRTLAVATEILQRIGRS